MNDYLVSLVLLDLSAGYVAQVRAEDKAKAFKIAFDASGFATLQRHKEIGSTFQTLARGESWKRKYQGPKMYPANGWKKLI
jgi:hypothetical protein